jgi:hypothetical protein
MPPSSGSKRPSGEFSRSCWTLSPGRRMSGDTAASVRDGRPGAPRVCWTANLLDCELHRRIEGDVSWSLSAATAGGRHVLPERGRRCAAARLPLPNRRVPGCLRVGTRCSAARQTVLLPPRSGRAAERRLGSQARRLSLRSASQARSRHASCAGRRAAAAARLLAGPGERLVGLGSARMARVPNNFLRPAA